MNKKSINKPLTSGKPPLVFLLILSTIISVLLFGKIFRDFNIENLEWSPDHEYSLLLKNIGNFIGSSIITILLHYFKKNYKETPTITFDSSFLYLEVGKNVINKIPLTDINEFHRPLIQSNNNSGRWEISYHENGSEEKLKFLVLQRNNFRQLRDTTRKQNPSVKFTGLFSEL